MPQSDHDPKSAEAGKQVPARHVYLNAERLFCDICRAVAYSGLFEIFALVAMRAGTRKRPGDFPAAIFSSSGIS
jgi:hypothetical protein